MAKNYTDDFLGDSAIELKESDLTFSPRSDTSSMENILGEPEDDQPPAGIVRQRVDNVSS